MEVDRAIGRPWTLALLATVQGEPLSPSAPGAEAIAGDVLGRVHSFLGESSRRDCVPADLLDWLADLAEESRNETAAAMVQVIRDRSESVKFSVVYGDPSPEVLVSADGVIGLIDWGTPSWGPQLHDVAAWLRWLGERPGAGSEREVRFLESYYRHVDVARADLDQLASYGRCADAFRFGEARGPGPSHNLGYLPPRDLPRNAGSESPSTGHMPGPSASTIATVAFVLRRITFFVRDAARTERGWVVRGEAGLGPPMVGDRFSFVHHQDVGEDETVELVVERLAGADLIITGGPDANLRRNDILGGEMESPT